MNSNNEKNTTLYKVLLFFISCIILLGQMFFIMNVLAHNEEIQEENEKLKINNQQLESYNKINQNKISLQPVINSLKDNIKLQTKFFRPKTKNFDASLQKLTDETVQSIIVFKNNNEEKIDHIEYFNKFGELIRKIFFDDKNNDYNKIEEYRDNKLFKIITLDENNQTEFITIYNEDKTKTEILNVYDQKTKTFIPFHVMRYNDKNVLLTMNKYSANNPGQIEEIILFDNKGEMTKIYHYTDNKLKSIKELNTIIPEETLVKTKVFHSEQEAEEFVSIVENKRYTKDTEAI
ncbi:hypothetical protein ODW08_01930 [Candidatus Phytoplasma australasiaticum]|uniref:hypothetical protein n=1 Tax=Candidatus Phytoplasma australasiaticum TaxID=2754999 RepID=UPI002108B56D|nr:hypothetical protein [Candidatus Phytoplasma australasiaticum]MDO8046716.1 hypothetical protein [Candidatus Phytoplasma australasiaticum]MDO8053241.1 hypothetical protein [Candidatus Phytoplasma australasiaticum]MDO8059673.1 hypothetical protein [Candidatus Phytoplasma australasiaticum]MDV3147946.1 hypothetical protein [Candidatus Phytoplasma australasiaticum]MDV3149843.1 hypothetical protein [Candidatus Phytoplasma australasiaticum]